jgi:heme-degrading monooxygenase HmoA
MTVIKINAITVPADSGDELARRFAARAGAVDGQPGFEGFELLRPTDDRTQWLVVTRWQDEESFQGWMGSPAFGHGHAGADRPAPAGGPSGPTRAGDTGPSGPTRAGDTGPSGPVGVSSELWSYEVAGGSAGPAPG